MRGESKSALKYLNELSKVDGLTQVKFASPVSRDPGNDMERFNIELQLDMKELRKSLKTLPAEASSEGAGVSPLPNAPPLLKKGGAGAVHNQAPKEGPR